MKTRSFSIYLLKDSETPQNALKDDHTLTTIANEYATLPTGAILFIADKKMSPPWWKDYWGIKNDLFQVQKGALIFLPIDSKWVALTFGTTYHQLKDESYEYDFGMRTTLNAIDPNLIKSTDILQPENTKRQRIQLPSASELTYFDFNTDENILKSLTGAVRNEYTTLFKNITGNTSIKVSSKMAANEISNLCRELIDIYQKDDYKTNFPDLQNIAPIKDPNIINLLEAELLNSFNMNPAPKELVLAIPDIIDYSNSYTIKYQGLGRTTLEFEDVFIGDFRKYLMQCDVQITNVTQFKESKLLVNGEDNIFIKSYSIYRSLLFDCTLHNKTYHFSEGNWYYVEDKFINKLKNILDPLFLSNHDYLTACTKKLEDEYNTEIETANPASVICLDKKDISTKGQRQIEPCDLIYMNGNNVELAHIKISTRSSSLSHLFNQGINSIQYIRLDENAKQNLINLTNSNINIVNGINSGSYQVVYGIISNKDDKKSDGLPLFSRISLLRTANTFKSMNIKMNVFYIKDTINRKS